MAGRLLLVLGDQLTLDRGALRDVEPGVDTVVMAEVAEEAGYVRHNRHKIALIFAAMRHFRDELEQRGLRVIYFAYEDGMRTLRDAVEAALAQCDAVQVRCCEPGENRLLRQIEGWQLAVPVELVRDDRFLCSTQEFADWAASRKTLRMEYFYRDMRRRYGLLLDPSGKPEGGKWNYDAENRSGWRGQTSVPGRSPRAPDPITDEVIALVRERFPDHPGDLEQFWCATTRAGALRDFQWFLDNGLENFGRYQDAMADDSPWLFHALVSMYMNIGLLDPLEVCLAVEERYRRGHCDLAAAEGFIRQVAGWREYVRGVYWLEMPDYGGLNALGARRPLPQWFWSGSTDMRCMAAALQQTLELGYAHHIQRLMVIGNFCLLAGLDVQEVCDWYLAVYVDAFEWVELPNTLGMALHADDGRMASKPYAASGKYIQRQGDYCSQCVYSPNKMTGEGACPFNSLYWAFVDRHLPRWKKNNRMALTVRNWERKSAADRTAILRWAEQEIDARCA